MNNFINPSHILLAIYSPQLLAKLQQFSELGAAITLLPFPRECGGGNNRKMSNRISFSLGLPRCPPCTSLRLRFGPRFPSVQAMQKLICMWNKAWQLAPNERTIDRRQSVERMIIWIYGRARSGNKCFIDSINSNGSGGNCIPLLGPISRSWLNSSSCASGCRQVLFISVRV